MCRFGVHVVAKQELSCCEVRACVVWIEPGYQLRSREHVVDHESLCNGPAKAVVNFRVAEFELALAPVSLDRRGEIELPVPVDCGDGVCRR